MNREQRRRMSRGKRAGGVAGISLVAFTGLFGGYMGGGRPSRAYAAPSAPTCASNTSISIGSEADWRANAGAATNPSTECVTLSLTSDFSITQTSPFFWTPGSTNPVKLIVDGNGHTVTGDANVPSATFLGIGMTAQDKLYVTDLTIASMHTTTFPGAAIDAYGSPNSLIAPRVYLDDVTVKDGNNVGQAFFRPQVYIRGRATISNSTFDNNSNTATARTSKHDGPAAAVMLYGPVNGSKISDSTFSNNSIVANLGASPAPAGQSYGAALAILNNWRNPSNAVTVERSTFTGNSVLSDDSVNRGLAIGGAIMSGATLTVTDSVFEHNTATGGGGARGGAIQMGQGWAASYQKPNLTVIDSQFVANAVRARTGPAIGGAIGSGTTSNFATGDVSISGSTFSGNTATSQSGQALGGAVGVIPNANSNRVSLVNSTLTANTTSGTTSHRGGAIYAKTAPLSVDFSTITGNTSGEGGGIFSAADDTITNSIVNLNTALYARDAGSYGTTASDHSVFTVAPPGGSVIAATFTPGPDTVFTSTPQVDALANNGGFTLPGGATIQTMALKSGVAARGAGTVTPASGVLPANDQRGPGFSRILQCTVSMGALAAVGPNPPCPAAPTNLTATPGDRQASIGFTPAVAGTSPITNYEYTLDDSTWVALNPVGTTSPITIPGLTNGQTYSVRLRAMSAAGAGTASASVSVTPSAAPPPPPPPPPVYPPSAPRDVTAVADNASAAVAWREPADTGTFPITDYVVTAGPGGQTCLAKAPALTCTVTGLTNGTAYTFVVKALNGAGWSPESAASPAVTPSSRALTLDQGQRVREGSMDRITTGGTTSGIPAGAKLTPYIRYGDEGDFVKGEATIVVRPDGTYTWSRLVQTGKDVTAYVVYEDLTSNRVTWGKGSPRSLTLFQGKRTADGMHDRIRTGGTRVGVPEGALLTPWIRYGDSGSFVEGVASIVVDAQGNFVWTREIRKDKKFTAYVAYEDLESNRVVWKRVR